ncbi:MAG: asparaginase domain-containing protein [Desulfuromusa sp.]|nr:asparaginase domain-containing protein [Desulfuromusa sp.]
MTTQRILPIHIGGTIASASSETGFKPKLSFVDLLSRIDKELVGDRLIDQAQSPFGQCGIDSARMKLSHIQKVAETVCSNYDQHDAFIITHGTDTLAYTASMLAFMLQGIQKPVIVTGAQKTIEDKNSDVVGNLETALLAASTQNSGVWVAFNGKIIKAVRAMKIDIGVDSLDAFTSNLRDEISIYDFQRNDYAVNKGLLEAFDTEVSEAVDIFYLSHTTNAVWLKNYLENSDLKALIVLIYGMSGHREELMEVLSCWANDNEAVVIAKTHSPYGSTDLSKYELGVKALKMGILSSLDITLESLYAKTCYLITRGGGLQEFRRQFYSDFCGELDESVSKKFREKSNFWLSIS